MKLIRKKPEPASILEAPPPAVEPAPVHDDSESRAILERIARSVEARPVPAPAPEPAPAPKPSAFTVTVTKRDKDGRIETLDISPKSVVEEVALPPEEQAFHDGYKGKH